MPKKRVFDPKKEVRAIARERVGTVKPSRPIEPMMTANHVIFVVVDIS